jgi:hypothetical protein
MPTTRAPREVGVFGTNIAMITSIDPDYDNCETSDGVVNSCAPAPTVVPVAGITNQQAVQEAERLLESATSFDELKDVHNRAALLEALYGRVKAGLQEQNRAAAVKIQAERRMGEALSRLQKAKGGQPYQTRSTGNTVLPVDDDDRPTLKEIGVTKIESSRWQALAAIAGDVVTAYFAEATSRGVEVTTAGLRRFTDRLRNREQHASGSANAENEDLVMNINEEQRDAEGDWTSPNLEPVVSAPAAAHECSGLALEQGEAAPKRRRAPANEARASDKRVEDVLNRLAALSPEEQLLVADAMADWGLAATPPVPDETQAARESETFDTAGEDAIEGTEAAHPVVIVDQGAAPLNGLDSTPAKEASEAGEMLSRNTHGEQDAASQICDRANGTTGSKYYPGTDVDPYNQQGLAWINGGLEIEIQLLPVVAKVKQFPKAFIDSTLERISQLFETLEGQGVSPTIYELLRKYGYNDVVDQAIAHANMSKADAIPPLLEYIDRTGANPP